MKQCIKCLQNLNLDSFKKHETTGNLRNVCTLCFKATKVNRRSKLNFVISIKEKNCNICKIIKPAKMFHKNKLDSSGLSNRCKDCRRNETSKYYDKNKNKIIKRTTNYWLNNKEKVYSNRRKRSKVRRQTDPFYKIKRKLRNRLYYALLNTTWKKNTHFAEYIGCDKDTLLKHLSSQFQPGMSFSNHGEWHLDHRIPLASAKTEEELYKLCHYTNLQPLWAIDNIKKADKF